MGSCASVPLTPKEIKIQPAAVIEDPKPLEIRIPAPDIGGDYYGRYVAYSQNSSYGGSWDSSDDE